jgi:5-methyltetrahydropteroyltriglutamate--homocysteine methyltransferase
MDPILPTSVVGSYPQPDWLIDRANLKGRLPPRVRAHEIWRVPPAFLEQAQDDATLIAIRDQERAGIDIITDGEIRRESYSNRFATSLSGVDIDRPGSALDRTGHANPVPRVTGPIRRTRPVEVRDVEFLRRNTRRKIKITIPGPFTMAQQAQNDHYPSDEALAMDYAAAVNAELRELKAAGADVIQLDEPYLQARPEKAKAYGVKAINRALEGVPGPTAIHLCFGYAHVVHVRPSGYSFLPELAATTADQISIEAAQSNLDLEVLKSLPGKTIILGVISLGDPAPETPDVVAARIRRAFKYVPPERIVPAPDCGMKYISREAAFAKLKALAEGTDIVRREVLGR